MSIKTVAVIGLGNIGTSVACDLLLKGYRAVLVDVSARQLETAFREIKKVARFAPLLDKRLPRLSPETIRERLQFTTNIVDIKDCDFVVENVPEEWHIKEKLYPQIDSICREEVCIGMNTSCTSITRAGSLTKRPDKVIGVHFMNPVYIMPTVEVIRGYHTSDETLDTLNELLEGLGKEGIVVNDLPGFVSNRISHLFMNEAAFVIQDNVANVKDVDNIFKKCFGHKMGPLETADLIGLDTVMKSIDTLYENYLDPKFRCCPLIKKMVYAGQLGRKTGKGFYEYPTV